MKRMSLAMLMVLGLSTSAFASWELLNDESSLHYISIKDLNKGELNTFKELSGSVSDSGAVSLSVNLRSVDTKIPIRDERMQNELFEVEQFAAATISGNVDLAPIAQLAVGETYTDTLELTLSLHGVSKEVSSAVRITRLSAGRVLVSSLEPVIINADEYGLAQGIEKLRNLASLPTISWVVPVTYSLVFQE